jgi:phosphate:Na+ symporter
MAEHNITLSDMALNELGEMRDKVLALVNDSLKAMKTRDKKLAGSVQAQEDAVDELEQTLRENHIERLNNQQCAPGAGVVFLDVINNLERIADHADNISKFVLD